jgi:hypothetical protein
MVGMTPRRSGTTATQRPARYAKLLGGHWAEKRSVEVAAGVILIRFDSGQVVSRTPEESALVHRGRSAGRC